MMTDRILVSGSTGAIGKLLIPALTQSGHQILAVRREPNWIELKKKILEFKPTCFLHLATKYQFAHTFDAISEHVDASITFPTKLMDLAFEAGTRKMLFAGTGWQNGDELNLENTNLYICLKNAWEEVVKFYISRGAAAISLRVFDTFYTDDNRPKIFQLMMQSYQHSIPFECSGCEQTVYMNHMEDVVTAFQRALQFFNEPNKNRFHRFEVRYPEPVKLKQFVETVNAALPKPLEIQWGRRPYRDHEFMKVRAVHPVLPGWSPKFSLAERIKLTVAEMIRQKEA